MSSSFLDAANARASAKEPLAPVKVMLDKKPVMLKRQMTNREGEDLAEPLPKDLDLKKEKIKLYGFDFSPPCMKVRVLLNYYGIPYEWIQAMPGQKKDDLDDSYKKVPKLVIGERQINDSAVIFRTLAPFLTGSPMTQSEILLEKDNNIRGFLGALEKETASSYYGIVCASSSFMASWSTTTGKLARPVLPYVLGLVAPLPWALFKFVAPHGRDGTSMEFGKRYQAALGDKKYFSGEAIGPLDLSLYGTFKCFGYFNSPPAAAVLKECGLKEWYERCDAAVNAVKPIEVSM